MTIEITARHMHATKALQDYAERKAEELAEEFPRIEFVHVILDVEKHLRIAEVCVQARGHVRVETRQETDNLKVSIEQAFDKVEKQLRKLADKAHDHKPAMKRGREVR